MGIRSVLKGAVIAGFMVSVGAGSALAQACEETEFSSKTGQLYLDAEQAAMTNNDYVTAANKMNQLKADGAELLRRRRCPEAVGLHQHPEG
jgi:hypothetical protein